EPALIFLARAELLVEREGEVVLHQDGRSVRRCIAKSRQVRVFDLQQIDLARTTDVGDQRAHAGGDVLTDLEGKRRVARGLLVAVDHVDLAEDLVELGEMREVILLAETGQHEIYTIAERAA